MKAFVAVVPVGGAPVGEALIAQLATHIRLPGSPVPTITIDEWGAIASIGENGDLRRRTPDSVSFTRDPFGVRPMYAATTEHALVISDSLEAVLAHPGVDAETLDEGAVADYLDNGVTHDAWSTIYAKVRRIPPAHTIAIDREGYADVRRYWTLELERPIVRGDEPARLEAALEDAIAERVDASRAVVFLSGGVDSSALAALTREVRPHTDLLAATSVYRTRIPDVEESFAAEAARSIGIPIRFFALDDYAPLGALTDRVWTPEPGPLLSAPMTRAIYGAAAEHGPVALHGHPADALLSADPLPFLERISIPRLLVKLAQYTRVKRKPPWFFARDLLGMQRATPHEEDRCSWLHPSLAERVKSRRAAQMAMSAPEAIRALLSATWSNYFEWAHPLQTRAPITLVYPWCDLRVVETVLSMEAVPWLIEKHIVREMLRGRVSETIRTRRKSYLQGDPWVAPAPQDLRIEAAARYIDPLRFRTACGDARPLAGATLRAAAFEYWLRELPARITELRRRGVIPA